MERQLSDVRTTKTHIFSNIYETKLEEKDCYVVKIDDVENFIDKKTSMFVKIITIILQQTILTNLVQLLMKM